MKKLIAGFLLIMGFFSLSSVPAFAIPITTDPQYVVMNFSDINELNWAAPEEQWQKEIKPKVLAQVRAYKNAVVPGNKNRQRAWSTLMEYMNFPLDTPSENSIYAIKMRRILEISEEEDLPVFVPLNGFQWWDELPELYNWWDPDGTNTPASFFSRQDNPADFKARFIKGYNPDNIWNVEWENYTTPMNLNHRNWGGGDFTLAPPPNLLAHSKTKLTYRTVLEERVTVILSELVKKLEEWEKEDKLYLFVGISLGTEISLNASLTSTDFSPYGYRAIQDFLCPQNNPRCGTTKNWSRQSLRDARKNVVAAYLLDLSRLAVSRGIPKQRVYTHVWGEVEEKDDKYTEYALSAFNLYSRPGMSFYGFAEDPLALPIWNKALYANGEPSWGAVEYSANDDLKAWQRGTTNIFDSSLNPGKLMVIYNWGEKKDTAAIAGINQILSKEPSLVSCAVPEIIPTSQNVVHNPKTFSWKFLAIPSRFSKEKKATLYIEKGLLATQKATKTFPLSVIQEKIIVPVLEPGPYVWYVGIKGCDNVKAQFSEPQMFTVSFPTGISWKDSLLVSLQQMWKNVGVFQ